MTPRTIAIVWFLVTIHAAVVATIGYGLTGDYRVVFPVAGVAFALGCLGTLLVIVTPP